MSRRRFLGAISAGVGLLVSGSARAHLTSGAPRSLSFFNIHTAERLEAEYWVGGAYLPDALAAINDILRDYRNGEIHDIDTRLVDLLHAVHGKIGSDKPFQVISGYRSPATNELLRKMGKGVAKNSLHMAGKAIDVSLSDRKLSELRRVAVALRGGGVGYYPSPGFVHIDVGRVRYW